MDQTKRPYETTFIVNASIDDTQIEATIARMQQFISNNGGEIVALNRIGRKRMAYTIRKKNNGFYVNIEFKAAGSLINQLERMYQLDENILRYLTIQLDKKALQARLASPPASDSISAPPVEREPLFSDNNTLKNGTVL